jgi:hypothetical protein
MSGSRPDEFREDVNAVADEAAQVQVLRRNHLIGARVKGVVSDCRLSVTVECETQRLPKNNFFARGSVRRRWDLHHSRVPGFSILRGSPTSDGNGSR